MRTASANHSCVAPIKLQPPPSLPHEVARPRLTTRLQAGLTRPLTLICAPAGFGKTTLLAAAVADSPWPVAWLSLDSEDSHLPRFLQSLVAAIQRALPLACRATASLLERPALPPVGSIAAALQQDLAEPTDDLVVVLDDYHAIDVLDVHALLVGLLRRPAPSLHVAVAARKLPPWPRARLRAAEAIAELGPDDLRFTVDEAHGFLARAARQPLGLGLVTAIHARTGGWAAELRLAAIALREGSGADPVGAALEGRGRDYATQYLLEEVVAHQAPDVQRFLHRTAIVDRFSAHLANALMDWTDPGPNGARVL